MTDSTGGAAAALALLQQLALELAFVGPTPTAAVSLGEMLGRIDAACATAPGPVRQAVAACRHWLSRDASGGGLTAETIRRVNDWQPWMVEAVMAWDQGRQPPAVPEAWAVAAARPASDGAEGEHLSVTVLPEGFDDEMIELFCSESQELLQEMEQGVLALERNPADSASIDTVFRVFHTFKGNAGVLRLVVLQRLTHELESVLDAARRGRLQLGRDAIDLILAGGDVLRRYIDESLGQLSGRDRGRSIPLPVPQLIARVRALVAGGGAAPSRVTPPPAAEPVPHPVLPAEPLAPTAAPATATPEPAVVTLRPEAPVAAARPAEPVPAVAEPSPSAGAAPTATATVRVDTLKLDGLIDLVGELVVAQSMIVQSPELRGLGGTPLARSLGQLRGITSDLQRTALALRMVPIGGVFRRMTRLVRDLSVELGKEIQLELEGEETELDRTLVEQLADPLVHMIRNSADHGIEPAADRMAAGKPPAGTITLRAFHRGGCIVVRVEDDGRGLSADRILARAVERGLVPPGTTPRREEILDLIFRPGFSTAERVTGLSGRGVGMDVVRRGIEGIRGTVEVASDDGRGTTFTLTVPLTLAIIEGLIVGVGDQRYVLPTPAVRESFRPSPGMVTTVQGRGELVDVRGRLVPLLRLGRFLGAPARADEPTEGIVVVVESGQDRRCLLVDDLLGKQEVVIKSLGEVFRGQAAFAGAAILGDGRVGLVLDIHVLVKRKTPSGEAA